ncbi:sensor histidine kinase [Streptomyces abyssomicinicus]|uniref:sensor histidine kinase n=1 Tax=Streptomyces abyssomicinicus TaxID=574929 RepID=UPI00125023B3|nr:sensor histidine kinase [Streptomyces abyssomicinicus]
MQRLYDFIRSHQTWVDGFWAVLLVLPSVAMGDHRPDTAYGERPVVLPLILALGVATTLRSRMPERMLLLATAAGALQLVMDVPILPADFALLMTIYSVAVAGSVRASRAALVVALLAAPLVQLRWPEEKSSLLGNVVILVFQTVPLVFAWVLGDARRTRSAYFAQLEERAARLERERESQAKIAVAAERARIARELHDVVAHNVSVMVVQADGAAYVLDTAPEQSKKALETISATGRQALAEMRRLLGVLRTGEQPVNGEYVPQPDVAQIEDLVEQCRGAGLTVDFKVEGSPRPLPSGVELTAYRIVQEALTNVRKHAGPEAGAGVRLVYFDDGLGLLVEDDGRGAPPELCAAGGADGQGQGLIGMRERVGMVGGTLDAGPRPDGGFRISALLPLRSSL